MDSDYDDNVHSENHIYRRKHQLLFERCEAIQQDNERLVRKIHTVRKLLIRHRMQRTFLMDKLDKYNDDWRNADYPLDIGIDENGDFVDLINHPPEKPLADATNKDTEEKLGKKKKRKIKSERDPNAPKKPPNPFFRYCQEQRSTIYDQMISAGITEPTKQEVTKRLAKNWNALTRVDKMVYYDMYNESRERYKADVEQYATNKAKLTDSPN